MLKKEQTNNLYQKIIKQENTKTQTYIQTNNKDKKK